LMIMKSLEVRQGEESKLFFLETAKVINEKNLKIYYVTLKNLLKISMDSKLEKAPDPLTNIIGFSLRTSNVESPKKSKKAKIFAERYLSHRETNHYKKPKNNSVLS
jgi:hypothetical protein